MRTDPVVEALGGDYRRLPLAEQKPEQFEAYLRRYPQDFLRREAALHWYQFRPQNADRLRYHTLQMIASHPGALSIWMCNTAQCYRDPAYRALLIQKLEEQVKAGKGGFGAHDNLAELYVRGAVPVSPESRAEFLRYYQLPANAPIPTTLNTAGANRAVAHYKAAIQGVRQLKQTEARRYFLGSYSEDLIDLLVRLERNEEAIAVAEQALPEVDPIGRADFLVAYGTALRRAKQTEKARQILNQVRPCDKEGEGGQPAHATARAETELGLLALDQGDRKGAIAHLLASANVAACCHNKTQPALRKLATRLLEAGEREAVTQYCARLRSKFGDDPGLTALLQKSPGQK